MFIPDLDLDFLPIPDPDPQNWLHNIMLNLSWQALPGGQHRGREPDPAGDEAEGIQGEREHLQQPHHRAQPERRHGPRTRHAQGPAL
jgi:hypothetical protein